MVATVAPLPPLPRGSSDAIAFWRKQLKPWLTSLREARVCMHLPPLATVSDMETTWIIVSAPTGRRSNPDVWTLLIEALEIVELLTRVDHEVAWHLLFEAAGIARTLELYVAQFLPKGTTVLPRFVVHINTDELLEEPEIVLQSCIRLIIVNEQTSSTYARVKNLLMAQWQAQHDGRALDRETDGRVKLSLNFRATMDFDHEAETGYVFTQIQNIAYAHADLSLLARIDNEEGEEGDENESGNEDETGEGAEGDEAQEETAESREDDEEQRNGEAGDDEGGEEATGTSEHGEDQYAEQDEHEELRFSDVTDAAENETEERGQDDSMGETVEERNPNPPPRGPFVIESFRFQLLDHPVSNMLLYMLNEAGKLGMGMSHVTISTLWHERLHHSVIGGFLLNQLVPWRGNRDKLGIQHLTIDLGGFDAAGVRSLCTAIAHSRSLRSFQFRADGFSEESAIEADGDVWWPWLAYALFSGDADHHIDDVWLNLEGLEKNHVEIIRQVLAHSDPLAFLFHRALNSQEVIPSQGPAMATSLNPSALLRLGHHRIVVAEQDGEITGVRVGEPGVHVGEPGVTYQVVRNRPEEDYIEVLLPGTGVCWTDRSELIELQPLTRRQRHSIRTLSVERLDDESAPAFIKLLPLIGEPLEKLVVVGIEGTTKYAVFEEIRASCPNLKRLCVTFVDATSIDWLYSPTTEWTLESLVLHGHENDPLVWSPLFTHLSDSTKALTKSLRELHVDIPSMSGPVDRSANQMLTMVDDMLQKNHRLVRCEVARCGKTEFDKHKDRIMAHHNEPLCVEKAPLPREAKLAFLSVTTPLKDAEDPAPKRAKLIGDGKSARTKLDSHVLRTIMEMAAESEHRICGIAASEHERLGGMTAAAMAAELADEATQ